MPVVESPSKLSKVLKSPIIKVVAAVVVVVGLALVLWAVQANRLAANGKGVCTPAILRSANANLDPTKVVSLEPIVNQIKQTKGYDKDANCLYVVTAYFVNISDADNAQKSLDSLTEVYDASKGFGTDLKPTGLGYQTLVGDVAFLHENAKQSTDNARGQ